MVKLNPEVIDHDEAQRRVHTFQLIGLALVGMLVLGSIFYHYVEGWRWLDAVYFSVVSLATVGYGDFTPKTDIGKIFTMFYLVVGLAIFAAFINNIFKSRLAKQSLKREKLENREK